MSAVAEKVGSQSLQRSDEWLASRIGKITASRCGKILGLSKYGNRDDVMREMVREDFGAEREFKGNEATEWGTVHEADALAEYESKMGAMTVQSALVTHPVYDWLGASPDGLVGDDGLVECKAPYRAKYKEASPEYLAQMQLQMACTGRAWCDFTIWRQGEGIIVQRVPRDPDWLDRVLPELAAFHDEYVKVIDDRTLAAPYLEPLESRDPEDLRETAELHRLTLERDDLDALIKSVKDNLQRRHPRGFKCGRFTGVAVERKGNIDYKRYFKDYAPKVDLENYRAKSVTLYQIRESK